MASSSKQRTVSAHSEGMRAAEARVVSSNTFARSPRLREFLAFVVNCAVENRTNEVNEYNLGVQVFHKSPNYSPNEDNIVRVTARQLRSKLNEYHACEGSLDPLRLEIPKGGYVPALLKKPPAIRSWRMASGGGLFRC